jgi:hypothetical protein
MLVVPAADLAPPALSDLQIVKIEGPADRIRSRRQATEQVRDLGESEFPDQGGLIAFETGGREAVDHSLSHLAQQDIALRQQGIAAHGARCGGAAKANVAVTVVVGRVRAL